MAGVGASQVAFNGGVLSPSMWSRTDLERYQSGLARAVNVLALPHGGVYKRPGTHFVCETANMDKPCRLIPFRFSERDTYILEFTDHKMRVIRDDDLVLNKATGQPYELETIYAAEDLARLDATVQTGDVVKLVHASYPPQELIREDHDKWRFRSWAFGNATLQPPSGLTLVTPDGGNGKSYAVAAVNANGTQESFSSSKVTAGTASGVGIGMPNTATMDYDQCRTWLLQYGQKLPEDHDYYRFVGGDYYKSDYFDDYTTFLLGRKIISRVPLWNSQNWDDWPVIYYADGWTPHLSRKQGAGANAWMAEYVGTTIQQINGGLYGSLAALRKQIVDYVNGYNQAAYPTGINKLKWNASAGAAKYKIYRRETFTKNEQSITQFCLIGETTAKDFTDDNKAYDPNAGMVESSLSFTDPDDWPAVHAIFWQRYFVGRTDNAPNTYFFSRVGDYKDFTKHSPIQDDDGSVIPIDSRTKNELVWMVPLDRLLIGSTGGIHVTGLSGPVSPRNPDCRPQSYTGCAAIAPVVVGRTVVFVDLSRQTLLDFQYNLEADGFDGEDITVYAPHLFNDRRIVAMCHQENPESIIWLVMSDGTLLSCTYLSKQRVVSWTEHTTQGFVEDCATLISESGDDRIYFVVRRTVNGVERRYVEVLRDRFSFSGSLEDAFYLDCGLTYRGLPTSAITAGLEHLEGMTIQALADGAWMDGLVVKNGGVDLPAPASVIHFGLGYKGDIETLELVPAQAPDGIADRPRHIVSGFLHLENTVSCLVGPIGDGDDDLDEIIDQEGMQPKAATGHFVARPDTPANCDNTRLRIVAEGPYPFGLLSIKATEGIGNVV